MDLLAPALRDLEVRVQIRGVAHLAVGGGEGFVVVHSLGGAVGDGLGDDAAELFDGAADGEVGVGGVEVADADVGAVPGGGGAGGQEVELAVDRQVVEGVDPHLAGDAVAGLDVKLDLAVPVDGGVGGGVAAEGEPVDDVGAGGHGHRAAGHVDVAQVGVGAGGREGDAGVGDGRPHRRGDAGDGGGGGDGG